MAKIAEWLTDPAALEAVQVYFPLCIASAESIDKVDTFFLFRSIEIPSSFLIGFSFKLHVIFMGKSPLDIAQLTAVKSPASIGSSPKSNGIIWGGTV